MITDEECKQLIHSLKQEINLAKGIDSFETVSFKFGMMQGLKRAMTDAKETPPQDPVEKKA